MKPFLLFTLLSTIGLAGCHSLHHTQLSSQEEECHQLSPEDIGRRDGALGNHRTRVGEWEEVCLAAGVPFSRERYHQGEQAAYREYYCTPLNAVAVGEQGGIYSGVCNHLTEDRFLKFLRVGRRIQEIRLSVHESDRKIEMIVSGDILLNAPYSHMGKKQREGILNKQLIQLKQERFMLLQESTKLEERVALVKKEQERKSPSTSITANSTDAQGSTITYVPAHTEKSPSTQPNSYRNSGLAYPMNQVGPHPRYTQMQIVNDPTSPMPLEPFTMDPTRSDFGASEYERTSKRDLHRSERELLPPENNVLKKGTTLMIDKDWYPN
jgi:Protein of unknown function (DUF2799)